MYRSQISCNYQYAEMEWISGKDLISDEHHWVQPECGPINFKKEVLTLAEVNHFKRHNHKRNVHKYRHQSPQNRRLTSNNTILLPKVKGWRKITHSVNALLRAVPVYRKHPGKAAWKRGTFLGRKSAKRSRRVFHDERHYISCFW